MIIDRNAWANIPSPRLPAKTDKEIKSRFQVVDNPTSRLNRPTAASSARTQDSKAKIESRKSLVPQENKQLPEVKKGSKGIRSRVSDLLHGRRRSAQPDDKNNRTFAQSSKNQAGKISAKEAVTKVCDLSFTSCSTEVLITEQGEQVDRLASERDQQHTQATRQETPHAHSMNTARRRTRNSPLTTRRNPDDNEDRRPPPPTNSTESLRAHYLKDAAALQTEDARLETAIAGVQSSLDEIIAVTQGIEYPGFRTVVEPVIHSLAESILSAQNARAAVGGLGNATQRVMTDTLLMSEAVSRAATQARVMVGEIQNMVPGAQTPETS